MPPILALTIAGAVAAAGVWLQALTRGGGFAATLVGTAILWLLGWPGAAALGAFFVGASAVSRLAPDPGRAFDAKGTRRDAAQVLANGGWAALGALLELRQPGSGLWIVTASLAAAAADSWATATGGWSPSPPRSILTLRPVSPGTSGGVTGYGNAGALVGAASVGAAAALTAGTPVLFPLAVGVGMLGMLLDSGLGAGWQGRFHCARCDLPTERPVHRCGARATPTGGFSWLTNDGVNGVATAVAAGLGYSAWMLSR